MDDEPLGVGARRPVRVGLVAPLALQTVRVAGTRIPQAANQLPLQTHDDRYGTAHVQQACVCDAHMAVVVDDAVADVVCARCVAVSVASGVGVVVVAGVGGGGVVCEWRQEEVAQDGARRESVRTHADTLHTVADLRPTEARASRLGAHANQQFAQLAQPLVTLSLACHECRLARLVALVLLVTRRRRRRHLTTETLIVTPTLAQVAIVDARQLATIIVDRLLLLLLLLALLATATSVNVAALQPVGQLVVVVAKRRVHARLLLAFAFRLVVAHIAAFVLVDFLEPAVGVDARRFGKNGREVCGCVGAQRESYVLQQWVLSGATHVRSLRLVGEEARVVVNSAHLGQHDRSILLLLMMIMMMMMMMMMIVIRIIMSVMVMMIVVVAADVARRAGVAGVGRAGRGVGVVASGAAYLVVDALHVLYEVNESLVGVPLLEARAHLVHGSTGGVEQVAAHGHRRTVDEHVEAVDALDHELLEAVEEHVAVNGAHQGGEHLLLQGVEVDARLLVLAAVAVDQVLAEECSAQAKPIASRISLYSQDKKTKDDLK